MAEGRDQKYLGSVNGWPISAEPTTFPSWTIRLPSAWWEKNARAIPVTARG